jgi:CheY-like chemotaxis protein
VRTVPADLKGGHILVVDDNEASRTVFVEQLSSWGFDADAVDCGAAALHRMSLAGDGGKPYELVLLDLDMPDIDGAEVARRIKTNPMLRSAAIVLLTSVDAPSKDIDYASTGVDDQLVKPTRSSDLFRSLTQTLTRQRSSAPASGRQAAAAPTGAPDAEAGSVTGGQKGLRAARRGTSGKVVQIAVGSDASQQIVETALKQTDHTYFVVDNSMIATALVRELRPNLVVAEIPGPGETGMDLVRAVRVAGAETGVLIPFIAIADPAQPLDSAAWTDSGVARFVNLPIQPDQLIGLIESMICDDGADLPAAAIA